MSPNERLNPLDALVAQAGKTTGSGAVLQSAGERSAAGSGGRSARRSADTHQPAGNLLQLFKERGLYGRELEPRKHAVGCPWEQEHSDHRGCEDSDTVIWEARDGQPESFHCSHAHCKGRKGADVIALWCPAPTPEELFTQAQVAEPDARPQVLTELARAVCHEPLLSDAWATRVKEAGLAPKRAFAEAVAAARKVQRDAPPAATSWEPEERCGIYLVRSGELCYEKETRDGAVVVPLCNFRARISCEETQDDGAERLTYFNIEGQVAPGTPLPTVTIPSDRFNGTPLDVRAE